MAEGEEEELVLVTQFYEAFAKKDWETMAGSYAEHATFSDPAFPDLAGEDIGLMWRMLCKQAKGFELKFRDVRFDPNDTARVGKTVLAHWDATYEFGKGRVVHNSIDATIVVSKGKIIKHTDSFPMWKWTRMALGPLGVFLGWTSLVQNQVRAQAAANLKKFKARLEAS